MQKSKLCSNIKILVQKSKLCSNIKILVQKSKFCSKIQIDNMFFIDVKKMNYFIGLINSDNLVILNLRYSNFALQFRLFFFTITNFLFYSIYLKIYVYGFCGILYKQINNKSDYFLVFSWARS